MVQKKKPVFEKGKNPYKMAIISMWMFEILS